MHSSGVSLAWSAMSFNGAVTECVWLYIPNPLRTLFILIFVRAKNSVQVYTLIVTNFLSLKFLTSLSNICLVRRCVTPPVCVTLCSLSSSVIVPLGYKSSWSMPWTPFLFLLVQQGTSVIANHPQILFLVQLKALTRVPAHLTDDNIVSRWSPCQW